MIQTGSHTFCVSEYKGKEKCITYEKGKFSFYNFFVCRDVNHALHHDLVLEITQISLLVLFQDD